MIFDQNDHVSDGDDDDVHQVPLLTADQEGPGLGATSGKKKHSFDDVSHKHFHFHLNG